VGRLWLVPALILLSIGGCGASGSQEAARLSPADVVLDVYSGRPNPTWRLAPAGTQALAAQVAALPATEPVSLPEPLGYRGFGVWWIELESESTVHVDAFRGVVVEYAGDAVIYRADPQRQVERWLLERGRPYLQAPVYQAVLAELAQPD
jgi:hypothetical protein